MFLRGVSGSPVKLVDQRFSARALPWMLNCNLSCPLHRRDLPPHQNSQPLRTLFLEPALFPVSDTFFLRVLLFSIASDRQAFTLSPPWCRPFLFCPKDPGRSCPQLFGKRRRATALYRSQSPPCTRTQRKRLQPISPDSAIPARLGTISAPRSIEARSVTRISSLLSGRFQSWTPTTIIVCV